MLNRYYDMSNSILSYSFLIEKGEVNMKKYLIEITETLQKQITVTAINREAAEQIVREKYENQVIVLDESDYISTDFDVLKETRELETKGR